MRNTPIKANTIDYAGPGTDERRVRFWETRPFEVAVFVATVLVLIGIALPFLSGHSGTNQHGLRCQANLHVIGQALRAYSREHDHVLAPSLTDAMTWYVGQFSPHGRRPEISLNCPRFLIRAGVQPTTAQALEPDASDGGSPSYAYHGRGITRDAPGAAVVAHDRAPDHRAGTSRNFLYLDGTVRELNAEQSAKVLAELAAGHNPPRPEKLK